MSAKNKGALSAHLKKQNPFFYICALLSVAIMALLFVPWLTEPKAASVLTLILDSLKSLDLLIFLVPVTLGIFLVQILYLVTMFRPDGEPVFAGTVSVLLAGIMLFLFLFASDIAYSAITVTNKVYTDNFLVFIGADHWTWTPVIWFVLTLVQKWLTKLAHKKEVISYT